VTFGQSSDTHDNPTVQQFNHKVVEFIVDGLDPFYALDPVEVRHGSQYLLNNCIDSVS
jgi:hypothetical protein